MIKKTMEMWHKTYLFFFVVILVSCTGKPAKQGEMIQACTDTLNEKKVLEEDNKVAQTTVKKNAQQPTNAPRQKEMAKQDVTIPKDIDLNKIYEQSEVTAARCLLSNSQIVEFHNKHFKYPDIEPVTGRGLVDLVIEKDGTISDVIIIKGIHPALDKEFIRTFKMFPKFAPGTINGTAVRSKLRAPINARAM